MAYMQKFFIPLLCSFVITAASCSGDDESEIPSNAIPVNMMAGDPQSTIGGSDVYINSSANFSTTGCGIADLGSKAGFYSNPELSQIAQEVAVTPGNYYQIFNSRSITTVAGSRAIPLNTNYYTAHVDSWLYDKDGDISGARISYIESYPDVPALPEWNSQIELVMHGGSCPEQAEYYFDKNARIDSGYEIIDSEHSNLAECLEVDITDNRISFTNRSWTPNGKVEITLRVRVGSVYTRIFMTVESSC